jgi:hypothetical protein
MLEYRGMGWARAEAGLLSDLFRAGCLRGCERIDLRGNHFRPRDVAEMRAAIAAGTRVGAGFEPSDVRIVEQEPRPDPRLCTRKGVSVAQGFLYATDLVPSKADKLMYGKNQAIILEGRLMLRNVEVNGRTV